MKTLKMQTPLTGICIDQHLIVQTQLSTLFLIASKVSTLLPGADVPDPFGGSVETYEAVWRIMRPALDRLLNQLSGDTQHE